MFKQIQSLGPRTELMFPKWDGKVQDKGDYLKIETPTNPKYMWGNYLLFKKGPQKGQALDWINSYKKEFTHSKIFMTLTWDGSGFEPEAISEFLDQGFVLEDNVVLRLGKLAEPKFFNEKLECRPIQNANEWNKVLESHIEHLCPPGPWQDDQKDFAKFKFLRFQRLVEMGNGEWFGAYFNGEMIASAGVFWDETYIRFQEVFVNPKHRRKGLCRTLCFRILESLNSLREERQTVIITDKDGEALSAYKEIGFKVVQRTQGLRFFSGSFAGI